MSIIKYKNLGISVCTVQCVGESTRRVLTAPEFSSYVSRSGVLFLLLSIVPFLVRFKSYRRVVYGVLCAY